MKDFKDSLTAIKRVIKKEMNKIVEYLKNPSGVTYIHGIFDGVYSFSTLEELEKLNLRARRGIYVFKLKSNVTLSDDFNLTPCGATLNDDNKNLTANDILYLGKSKSVKVRLKQHFSENSSSPNSLKLGADNRQNLLGTFTCYIFTMDSIYNSTDGNKNVAENIILGSVEDLLHDELKPKVGSRRI